MIVALDVDGVLRDFNGSLERVYRKYNPSHDPVPEPHEWELHKAYSQCEDINKFAFDEHAFEIFSGAEPYPGAIHFAVNLWKEHTVVLTTTQYPPMRSVLLVWLSKYGIPYNNLMFTNHKYLVNADVLIDDSPYNLIDWVRETGKPAIQMLRSWNVSLAFNPKIVRCMTYHDIVMALGYIHRKEIAA